MQNSLIEFINSSPDAFHAINNIKLLLEKNGFKNIENTKISYGNYYAIRNDSSIIAFKIPKNFNNKINIISSHSDSPYYKLKHNPHINSDNYTLLNVAPYGGMIHSTFMDRPLQISGRVSYMDGENVSTKLIHLNEPVAIMPNLAIHLNRDANSGYTHKPGKDLVPIYSMSNDNLIEIIQDKYKLSNILSHDLYVSNYEKGYIWGNNKEFISSPRLDNLECAFISINSLIASEPKNISICAVFDNEEVGSLSYMGAASDFLSVILERISENLNIPKTDLFNMLDNSVAISADNAHAYHPNFPEKYDKGNICKMNFGPVIKFSNNQSYTTDSYSAAYFMNICNNLSIPYQVFENHSAVRGGSTLGNLLNYHTSIHSVDIGLAQLAMHSAFETAGSSDINYLYEVMNKYYSL